MVLVMTWQVKGSVRDLEQNSTTLPATAGAEAAADEERVQIRLACRGAKPGSGGARDQPQPHAVGRERQRR